MPKCASPQRPPVHSPIPTTATGNHLLDALGAEPLSQLRSALEPFELKAGQVLCEAEQPERFVIFPLSGLVALNYVTLNGALAAVALVGHEGLIGLSLFMSGARTLIRSEVICPGQAYRLNASALGRQLEPGGRLQTLALRYIQALTTQMAQTAACNRHHTVHQQLSRWLLLAFDRQNGDDLHLTQEQLANVIGVRREGVTTAACQLHQAGILSYSRGLIQLHDRAGLQARACECYGVVRREYDRLMPHPEAAHDV